MALPLADVILRVALDNSQLPAQAQAAGRAAGKAAADQMVSQMQSAMKRFATNLIGFVSIEQTIKRIIDQATKLESETLKVKVAAGNAGIAWAGVLPALRQAQQAGAKLGYSATEITDVYGILVTRTQDVAGATKYLSEAEDIARTKHFTLAEAANLVNRAHMGNVRALKDLGVIIPPASTAIERHAKLSEFMGRVHGQAAAYAQTLAGKEQILKAQVDNAAAAIGSHLVPALSSAIKFVSDNGRAIGAILGPIAAFIASWKLVGLAMSAFTAIGQKTIAVWAGLRSALGWQTAAQVAEAAATRNLLVQKAQLAVIEQAEALAKSRAATVAAIAAFNTAGEAAAMRAANLAMTQYTIATVEATAATGALAAAEDIASGGLTIILQLLAAAAVAFGAYAFFTGNAVDTTKGLGEEARDTAGRLEEINEAVRQFGISRADAEELVDAGKSLSDIEGLKVAYLDAAQAITDHFEQADQAVADTADAVVNAQRGLRDAQQGVADAQQGVADAWESVRDAQQGVIDADQGVRDARQGVADAVLAVSDAEKAEVKAHEATLTAQEELSKAREDAAKQIRDLRQQVLELADTEAQHNIDLQKARTLAAQTTGLDEGNIHRKEALLALSEAEHAVQDDAIKRVDLEKQSADATRKGVEGSDLVVEAKQKIIDAQESERESARGVLKAQQDVEKAQQGVTKAQREAEKAREGVVKAQRGVIDAERGVARAHEAVEGAEKSLSKAVGEHQTALDNDTRSTDINTKAGRENLKLYEALQAAQEALSPTLGEAMRPGEKITLEEAGKAVEPGVLNKITDKIAGVWSGAYEGFMRGFGSPVASWFRTQPPKLWHALADPVAHAFNDVKRTITVGFDGWWKGHGDEVKQVWSVLWRGMVGPPAAAWRAITRIVNSGPFKELMRDIGAAFSAGWDMVVGGFRVAWSTIRGIATVAFDAIRMVVKIGWDTIVAIFSVALDILTGHWGQAWTDIKTVGEQVWNAISQFFTDSWNTLSQTWSNIWTTIKDTFSNVWNDIKTNAVTHFNELIGIIRDAIDKINVVTTKFGVTVPKPDFISLDNAPPTAASTRFRNASGAVGFAGGGLLNGPGTATSDDIPLWGSKGEYVVRAAAVERLGLRFMDFINSIDKHGGKLLRGDPSAAKVRFAEGGIVGEVQNWLRAGADPLPYVFGAVGPNAFDCSGLVGEVWARLTGHPSNHRYFTTYTEKDFLTNAGFKPGKGTFTVGWSGEHTMGNLGGLAFEAANPSDGILVGSGASNVLGFPNVMYLPQVGDKFVSGGGGGIVGRVLRDVLTPMIAPLVNSLGGTFPPFGAFFGAIMSKVFDAILSQFGGASEAGGPGGGNTVSGTLGDWINAAIARTGVPSSWAGGPGLMGLYTLIMRESGGNPRAINNWDSNAARGDPSRGLAQTIGSTFEAYRDKGLVDDIYDPVANIVAAINYIKSRYGSIGNVQQADPSRAPMGYDSGGVLPPGLWNGTGKPEAVLTYEETQGLKSMVGQPGMSDAQMRRLAGLIAQAVQTQPGQWAYRGDVVAKKIVKPAVSRMLTFSGARR